MKTLEQIQRNRRYQAEYHKKYDALYHQSQRDHYLTLKRLYHETHRKQEALARKKRYTRFPEESRSKSRLYTVLHPEINRAKAERRRARLAGTTISLTKEQWETIQAIHDFSCAYCGHKSHNLTQDHVIPLSKGGTHTAENVVPACKSCNSSKGAKLPEQFRLGRLSTLL